MHEIKKLNRYRLLTALADGPKTFTELLSLGIVRSPAVLTTYIKSLEDDGLIKANNVPNDRRKKIYSLTKKWEDTDHYKQIMWGLAAYRTFQRIEEKLQEKLELKKELDGLSRDELINYAACGAGLLQLLQQEQAGDKDMSKAIEVYVNLTAVPVFLALEKLPKMKKAWKQTLELPDIKEHHIDTLLDLITNGDNKTKKLLKHKILRLNLT